jgi:hypothetical protein
LQEFLSGEFGTQGLPGVDSSAARGTPIPDCPISDTADCPKILSFCGALRSSAANRELGAAVMLSSALGEGKTMVGVAVAVALRQTFALSVLYIDASLDGDVIARWPAGSHLSWDQIDAARPPSSAAPRDRS